jgi:hypothetical protein
MPLAVSLPDRAAIAEPEQASVRALEPEPVLAQVLGPGSVQAPARAWVPERELAPARELVPVPALA